MGTTKLENIINPEVMADMIEAKIDALAKVMPYAKIDRTLVGVPGNTITVPAWNYIGDAEDVAEGESVNATTLTASSTTFTIKKAMKKVTITEEARLSGYGDPVGTAETQLAKSIYGKADTDLLNAAYSSRVKYDGSAAIIGYKPIVGAVGVFADEEDDIEKVMFVHPEQHTQLLLDSDFISADKFESGVAVKGSIGRIAGCWIKKSKKVRKVDAVTAVQGVYTVTIGGTLTADDVVSIAGVDTTLDSSSANTPTAAATALATALGSLDNYSVSRSGAVLTLTEKTGKEGTGAPEVEIESTAGTATLATTTAGVKASPAVYLCPIIKYEPDSPETEETEEEAPAITIYMKKDIQVDSKWNADNQTHEIVAAEYYGAALTNESKVVVAAFAQVAAE